MTILSSSTCISTVKKKRKNRKSKSLYHRLL